MKEYTGSVSVADYKKAIDHLTNTQKGILANLYQHGPFNNSNEIAYVLGYENFGAANLQIGKIGKSIVSYLDINIATLPKYDHYTGDKPSYYLIVHNFISNKWILRKNLKTAIEATLPVKYIHQLPVFTVCIAAGETSPIQILLAKDDTHYTVFSTERGGMIMTAQNKSVSKQAKVKILEIPIGEPENLIEYYYVNYEDKRQQAINELYKRQNTLSQQALTVLQQAEGVEEKAGRGRKNPYNLTSDEEQQELLTIQILNNKLSKSELYDKLVNQPEKEDEFIIIDKKIYRRDNKTVADIKYLRDYKCQLCGTRIQKEDGTFYIEAAHINEKCKGGKEAINNILILCPNHHKEFDFGQRQILKRDDLSIDFLLNGKEFKINLSIRLE